MKSGKRGRSRAPDTRRRRVNVGVSLLLRDGQQSLWENGIFQNTHFLVELLKLSPAVDKVFIVAAGPGSIERGDGFLADAPAPIIDMSEALDALDVMIELSAQVELTWALRFAELGKRIVSMHVASDFIIDAERTAFDLAPGFCMAEVPYHEVWTLPAFEATCAPYYRAALRSPVRVMPHLWSPSLLERAIAAGGTNPSFDYVPGRKRWRIGIFEPNICSVKTCHLPLLLSDIAHRMDATAIEYLRVYNALKLKEHREFVAYARSMDLVQQGLATFEGRFPIHEVLGRDCDAIVSHHWYNAQNYLRALGRSTLIADRSLSARPTSPFDRSSWSDLTASCPARCPSPSAASLSSKASINFHPHHHLRQSCLRSIADAGRDV